MLSAKDITCRVYSGILVVIWILAPYATLQHAAIFPVYWMPELAIDKAIPVCFTSIWVYFSFYLLLGIVGLTVEKRLFLRYLYTIGWAAMVAHMIFLFFPNGASRDGIDYSSAPSFYQWLADTDLPRNAFPSLHATLAVIAALAVQASPMKRFSSVSVFALKAGAWLWVLAIFWSTIALRQHVILDLIAGSVIAVVVWRLMKDSWEMKYHA